MLGGSTNSITLIYTNIFLPDKTTFVFCAMTQLDGFIMCTVPMVLS